MADRLASFSDFANFIKGGSSIKPDSEMYTAVNLMIDGISRRIASFILKSTQLRLAQLTSDGLSAPIERFGTDDYGLHKRNTIILPRGPVVVVSSVNDNGTLLAASDYNVDYRRGIIYRVNGRFFCLPQCVQVIYTAGFPFNGKSGDDLALVVPEDLRNASLAQEAYEYSRYQPGGIPFGAQTVSRPDGSIVIKAQPWLDDVEDVLEKYQIGI
jgi:hypothetical protein